MNIYNLNDIVKNIVANEIQIVTGIPQNKSSLYHCVNHKGKEYVAFERDLVSANSEEKNKFKMRNQDKSRFTGAFGWN